MSMFKSKSHFIHPMRIALFCASALMLSTALAEDGSNLSDLRAQSSGTSDYQSGNASPSVTNNDGTSLADLRAQNGKSDSMRDGAGQPINEDGTNLSALRAQSAKNSDAEQGYLTDSSGEPVTNSAGECFHTRSWTKHTAPCAQATPPKVVVEDDIDSYVYNMDDSEYFGFNKAVLSDRAKSDLNRLAADIVKADRVKAITVTGHADKFGSTPYNRKLAFRRADAVKAYLISKGIPADRISTESEGSAAPLVSCSSKDSKTQMISCMAPNRRVDVNALLASHIEVRSIDYGNSHS
jgi:OOP family OmpA-OmpF porin